MWGRGRGRPRDAGSQGGGDTWGFYAIHGDREWVEKGLEVGGDPATDMLAWKPTHMGALKTTMRLGLSSHCGLGLTGMRVGLGESWGSG